MICGKRNLLLILIFVISGISAEVKIEPDAEEFYLTKGANMVLKCTGDEDVEWHYPPSLGEETSKKTENQQKIKDDEFMNELKIESANYMDTGFYYCVNQNETEEDSIYLYVRDINHLLAVENPEDGPIILVPQQYDDFVIPCRPTFPEVNVTLERDSYGPVNAKFDAHKGFTINQAMLHHSDEYRCLASWTSQTQEATFTVRVLPRSEGVPKPEIIEEGYEGAHVIVGQNVAMTCRVTVTAGVQVALDWDLPASVNEEKVTISNLFTEEVIVRGVERRRSNKKLTIKNVSTDDQGMYTCRVTDHSRNVNQEHYELQVYTVDMKYLNLTMEGETDILVRSTEKEAQWIVNIEAYPTPQIKWHGPHNNSLFNNDKYSVLVDSKKTKITVHDVSIRDSGVYTLYASNSVKNTTLKVTLLVEDKPKVSFVKKSKVYFDINKEEEIDCVISAYPEPTVTWKFIPCTDDMPFCGAGHTGKPIPMEPEHLESISYGKWLSKVKWYARESGLITCQAENHLGDSETKMEFKVTDVNNGFDIWGPKKLVLVSDNIMLGCGASIYEYTPQIEWVYKSLKDDVWEILKNSSVKRITVITNKTSFSHQSFLDLRKVTADSSGLYKCRAKSYLTHDYQESEFKLLVEIPRSPSFTKYSNMNGGIIILDVGRPFIFNCTVTGHPQPRVSWFKNNITINITKPNLLLENNNQTLHILESDYDDVGKYRCDASNTAAKLSGYKELRLKVPARTGKTAWWMFALLIGLILVFLTAMVIFCIKYKIEQKKRKELMSMGLYNFYEGQVEALDPNIDIGEQAEYLPFDKTWEFPREKLKLGKQLGYGAFGVVLKAEAMDLFEEGVATVVAVKMVKKSSDVIHVKTLATELKIMAHLGKHLNVVNLLGACTTNLKSRELLVIVEYCRYGNLHKYLIHHRNTFINQIESKTGTVDFRGELETPMMTYIKVCDTNQTNSAVASDYSNGQSVQTDMTSLSTPVGEDGYLLNRDSELIATYQGDYKLNNVRPICTQDLFCWAYQVAKGMEYLASRKVLHGDLAARNILLAEGNVVKICDFGLAKSMYSRENYKNKKRNVPLPVKWMSIEAIRDGLFSTQSDIWSFGVVLWEMFSLAVTPYPGLYGEQFFNRLLEGYRMGKPKYATDDVYNMMLECWKEQPMLRPSFTELADRLGAMLSDNVRQHYLDLNSPYTEFNERATSKGDPLGKLIDPTYENTLRSGMPDIMDGYVCMKAPRQDAINEVELTPMITPGCNSFLNPGYQDLKNFKEHSYTNIPQDPLQAELPEATEATEDV